MLLLLELYHDHENKPRLAWWRMRAHGAELSLLYWVIPDQPAPSPLPAARILLWEPHCIIKAVAQINRTSQATIGLGKIEMVFFFKALHSVAICYTRSLYQYITDTLE